MRNTFDLCKGIRELIYAIWTVMFDQARNEYLFIVAVPQGSSANV